MILGICGSPRNANTELLLDKALESAGDASGLKTEKIRLKGKNINYCSGCFKCLDLADNDYGCQLYRDEMDEIFHQLKQCQGLILATPVYFGGVTGQLKTFMDRTEPLLRYAKGTWRYTLRNKVGGAIAVGGNRNGGQESTLIAIHHFFFIHDMIVVGVGPDEQPGCYLGGSAYSGYDPDKGSKIKDAVRTDELGIRSSEILGRRVAEVVLKIQGENK
jgi:multimeric flavodoxin WrbA